VNDARRGEGGKGDILGSTAKVEFCASMLNVMPGLMERLLSALLVGTPSPEALDEVPTGPTPTLMVRPRDEVVDDKVGDG
jgi:hypothetical protein